MWNNEIASKLRQQEFFEGRVKTDSTNQKLNGSGHIPAANPLDKPGPSPSMPEIQVFDVAAYLAMIQKIVANASVSPIKPMVLDMDPVANSYMQEGARSAPYMGRGQHNPLQHRSSLTGDAQDGIIQKSREAMTEARHFVVFKTMAAMQQEFYGGGRSGAGAALDTVAAGAAVQGLMMSLEKRGLTVVIAKSGEAFAKINDLIDRNGGKWVSEMRDLVDGSPLSKAQELSSRGELSTKVSTMLKDAPPIVQDSMSKIKDVCSKYKIELSSDDLRGFFKAHSGKIATALTLSPHANEISRIVGMSDDGVKGLFKLATNSEFRDAVGELSKGTGDSIAMLPGAISKGVGSSMVLVGHLLSNDAAKESLAPHLLRMALTIGAGVGAVAVITAFAPAAAVTATVAAFIAGEAGAQIADVISAKLDMTANYNNTNQKEVAAAAKTVASEMAKGNPQAEQSLQRFASNLENNSSEKAQLAQLEREMTKRGAG